MNFFNFFTKAPERPELITAGELLVSQDPLFKRAWYRDFELTDAIRPNAPGFAAPRAGYRIAMNLLIGGNCCLQASVTRSKIMHIVRNCVGRLGRPLNVVLESGHGERWVQHCSNDIDPQVVLSHLCDPEVEDLLLNDSCTEFAAYNERKKMEVYLTANKIINVYTATRERLKPIERFLKTQEIPHIPNIRFLSDERYPCYVTSEDFHTRFEALVKRFGADGGDELLECP